MSQVRVRRAAFPQDADAVATAVGAYLRRTEAEKSGADDDSPELPERYRHEVEDPATAYAAACVLVAELDDVIAGVVVAVPQEGATEIKRLWADPSARGRGVGSALLDAAIAAADGDVRLSVWEWRDEAMRLYASRGFHLVEAWDDRPRLVCMVRPA